MLVAVSIGRHKRNTTFFPNAKTDDLEELEFQYMHRADTEIPTSQITFRKGEKVCV